MSQRPPLWGLRAMALVIALLLWFFGTFEKREEMAEKVIEAGVTYNTPRGLILLNPVETVRVRVRGPSRKIRALNPALIAVLVTPKTASAGTLDFRLGAGNVVAPDDLEVVTLEPNIIRLNLDQEETAMKPVRPSVAGEPAAGALAKGVSAAPDRALVRGPRSRLEAVTHLETSVVRLEGHAFSFSERAQVLSPDPLVLVVEPSTVTIEVQMQGPSSVNAAEESPARRGGSR
jgi:YbbR domain-containing protein